MPTARAGFLCLYTGKRLSAVVLATLEFWRFFYQIFNVQTMTRRGEIERLRIFKYPRFGVTARHVLTTLNSSTEKELHLQ